MRSCFYNVHGVVNISRGIVVDYHFFGLYFLFYPAAILPVKTDRMAMRIRHIASDAMPAAHPSHIDAGCRQVKLDAFLRLHRDFTAHNIYVDDLAASLFERQNSSDQWH